MSPLFSAAFARGYVVTLRPYLCFVSGVAGLAGLATTPLVGGALVPPALAFFLAYGLGQALTDVTQLDTDRLSAPHRPLVRGEIAPRDVAIVSVVGLIGCAAALVLASRAAALLSIVPIVGLATYTPLKRRFWAGPVHNAWIFAAVPALGALAGRSVRHVLADARVMSVVGTAFFGYATFVLLGYLKDVEADRVTGYATLPVRFGRKPTVLVSLGCAALAVVVALPLAGATVLGLVVAVVGSGLLVAGHALAWTVEADREAHVAIAVALRGLVLLELGQLVAVRPGWSALALALVIGFELTLRRRPATEQI